MVRMGNLMRRFGRNQTDSKGGGAGGGGGGDVKRQVDNQDGKEKPIYELLNVKYGTGKLVDLIKSSAKLSSSSFNCNDNGSKLTPTASMDDQMRRVERDIEALVLPFLYNGGKGKLVPLKTIWELRFGNNENISRIDTDSNGDEYTSENYSKSIDYNKARINDNTNKDSIVLDVRNGEKSRWVCWRLDERGAVGETALHICFLLSTPTHMIIAKILLNLFPMLINDIYNCDEYFGESALVSE